MLLTIPTIGSCVKVAVAMAVTCTQCCNTEIHESAWCQVIRQHCHGHALGARKYTCWKCGHWAIIHIISLCGGVTPVMVAGEEPIGGTAYCIEPAFSGRASK
jgi:hypothetical protein